MWQRSSVVASLAVGPGGVVWSSLRGALAFQWLGGSNCGDGWPMFQHWLICRPPVSAFDPVPRGPDALPISVQLSQRVDALPISVHR